MSFILSEIISDKKYKIIKYALKKPFNISNSFSFKLYVVYY
jgi:hypothetical protein